MKCYALAVAVLLLVAACQTDAPAPEPEVAGPVEAGRAVSPEGAAAYFIAPEDGAIVSGGEVRVVFGLAGMGVAPAGVDLAETGHHHLLVDVAALPDMALPIPADSNHIHFGKGQTEAILTLAPGTHTLQMLLGDYRHIPHDPPVASALITITVE